MTVTVITPTANRPVAFALTCQWVARQTVQPDQWIIADGGQVPVAAPEGTVHVWEPSPIGVLNFLRNVQNGLAEATGDIIIFMEDDDWYGPLHIEDCVSRLWEAKICGSVRQRYYNVATRQWKVFKNIGACLSQTAIDRSLARLASTACAKVMGGSGFGLDREIWNRAREAGAKEDNFAEDGHVLGIKGLPGSPGIGVGHRPDKTWTSDPDGTQLCEWIGNDKEQYIGLCGNNVRVTK